MDKFERLNIGCNNVNDERFKILLREVLEDFNFQYTKITDIGIEILSSKNSFGKESKKVLLMNVLGSNKRRKE